MTTILSATSRGQVTIPKEWRDKFDTRYYMAEIKDDQIIIRPIPIETDLETQLEDAWGDYKKGKVISHEDLIKQYGL